MTSPLPTVNRAPAEWDELDAADRAARLSRAGVPAIGVRMDVSPAGKNVTKPYVEDAAVAALAGKLSETTETPAVGCAVRYVRERK